MTSFTPASFEALSALVNKLVSDLATLTTKVDDLESQFYDHLDGCECDSQENSEDLSSDIILEYHNSEEEDDEEEDVDVPVTIINNTTNNITNILPTDAANEDGTIPSPEPLRVSATCCPELKQSISDIKSALDGILAKILDIDTSNTEINCKLNSVITACGENSGAVNRIETFVRENCSYHPPVQESENVPERPSFAPPPIDPERRAKLIAAYHRKRDEILQKQRMKADKEQCRKANADSDYSNSSERYERYPEKVVTPKKSAKRTRSNH